MRNDNSARCIYLLIFFCFPIKLLLANDFGADVIEKIKPAVIRVGNCQSVPTQFANKFPAKIKNYCEVHKEVGSQSLPVLEEHGTGFLIGHEGEYSYVVTNWHVVAKSQYLTVYDGGHALKYQRKAIIEILLVEHDLVVLKVKGLNKNRTPLVLRDFSEDDLRQAENVWTYGYPDWVEKLTNRLATTPRPGHGIVSGLNDPVPLNGTITYMIHHRADAQEGFSGGPLVDVCSRVIGINQSKHKKQTGEFYSIKVSYLIKALKKKGIKFRLSNSTCNSLPEVPAQRQIGIIILFGLVLSVSLFFIIWLLMQKRKQPEVNLTEIINVRVRSILGKNFGRESDSVKTKRGLRPKTQSHSQSNDKTVYGYLIGHNKLAKQAIKLTGDELIIGRESGVDYKIDEDVIGRRHVRLAWDKKGGFTIQDLGSTNGSYFEDARPISTQPVSIQPGARFYLAETEYTFQLLPSKT